MTSTSLHEELGRVGELVPRERAASRWLPAALCELGALLVCCGLAVLGLHGCAEQPQRRVVVLAWGGATWNVIDPLIAAGKLPNLAALAARGRSAELESLAPPTSAAAWVSLATGAGPGRSGVHDWVHTTPDSPELELTTAADVRAPFVWETASAAGLSALVVGAPLTAPADAGHGFTGTLVAGSPVEPGAAWTRPAALAEELAERGIEPDPLGITTYTEFSAAAFRARLDRRREFLLERLARDDWDLAWIAFEELDELHPICWPGPGERDLIDCYRALDALLGEVVAACGPGTDVLVVSQRGHGLYEQAFGLYAMLLHEGFCSVNAPVEPFDPPRAASRLEVARAEHAQRLAIREFQLTRVIPGAVAGNYGSLRLALEGRESWAVVPFEHLESIVEDVSGRLEDQASPRTLESVLVGIESAHELYPGAFAEAGPDLVFEFEPGLLVEDDLLMRKFRGLETPRSGPQRAGVYVAAGPSVEAESARGSRPLTSIADEVLTLLGLLDARR